MKTNDFLACLLTSVGRYIALWGRKLWHTVVMLLVLVVCLGSSQCPRVQIEPRLDNPYRNHPYWYKVQVHTHSTRSDGHNSPGKVFRHYVSQDYRAVALTDHDQPCGVIFDDPLEGSEIIGIVYVPSEEDGDAGDEHMLAIGLNPALAPDGPCGPRHSWNAQRRIDCVVDQGGIAVLAHPYDADHGWNENTILNELDRFHGLEIYQPGQAGPDGGNNARTVNLWDRLLNRRRRVWGFAADDCHNVDGDHFNRGWLLVNSDKVAREYWEGPNPRDPADFRADLLANIKAGNFVAVERFHPIEGPGSRDVGPVIRIQVLGGLVVVDSEQECDLIRFVGGPDNELHRVRRRRSANYELSGSEKYVRVEVVQTRHGERYRAYSQPLFVLP